MKKTIIILTTALLARNGFAQNQLADSIPVQENVLEINQNLDTITVKNSKSAIFYKLILEYGMSLGIERYYYKDEYGEEMGVFFRGPALSLVAINNISFNDRFLLGIGGGLEYRTLLVVFPIELAGVCFLNFRYYFNKPEKTVIPMLNIAIGGRMAKGFGFFVGSNPWMTYGVYSTFGAGFKVKRFSLHSGVLFWTRGYNLYGVDAMIKVGLTF